MIAISSGAHRQTATVSPSPGLSKEATDRLAVDWEYMFVFDSIVFLLTFVKGYRKLNNDQQMGVAVKMPLITAMVRDGTFPSFYNLICGRVTQTIGTLYFLSAISPPLSHFALTHRFGISGMTVANAANVGTFYLNSPHLRGSLSALASSISVTLASRIMLNLHRSHTELMIPSAYITAVRSNIRFQTVISENDRISM
ncbi:hypothetical protein DL96DRAFT_1627132 [Flagelloscypha sp. PMI_526]|nr:hypothetical protein DL96DRAFT_1627132 [Flagelloscypha sp. PMI_526]